MLCNKIKKISEQCSNINLVQKMIIYELVNGIIIRYYEY